MNITLYKKLKDIFFNYVKLFYNNEANLEKPLQDKLEHINRVAQNCSYIAKNINCSNNEIYMAEICGLYHDIGRFSQFKEYKTFDDSKSVNHGLEGYNAIIKNNLLSDLVEDKAALILNTVKYHNALNLPQELSKDTLFFTNIVRDADKLDIIFMVNNAIVNNEIFSDKTTVWNLEFKEANNDILDKILSNKSANYSDVKSATDVCILQLGWVYDMKFSPALQLIKETKCIENISAIIPTNDKVKKTLTHISNYINQRL